MSIAMFQSLAMAQSLEPGFARTILEVRGAEAAGVDRDGISNLVSLLNKALELNREAGTPNMSLDERNKLLAKVDQMLTTIQQQAIQLSSASQQRLGFARIAEYLLGVTVAFVGAVIYDFSVALYQRYRIERAFQMRIKRK
jgi:hypothetical protein